MFTWLVVHVSPTFHMLHGAWVVAVTANLRTWCYPARAGIYSMWAALSKLRVRMALPSAWRLDVSAARVRLRLCSPVSTLDAGGAGASQQFNICCTIEGRTDDELDEVALGVCSFGLVDVDGAPSLEL